MIKTSACKAKETGNNLTMKLLYISNQTKFILKLYFGFQDFHVLPAKMSNTDIFVKTV